MQRRKQNSAKQRELQREWEEMLARHSKPLERGAKAWNVTPKNKPKETPVVQEDKPKKDLSKMMGVAAKKESMQYTGNMMLGVTVLHKSCLQPIFNEQAAKDAASMRR